MFTMTSPAISKAVPEPILEVERELKTLDRTLVDEPNRTLPKVLGKRMHLSINIPPIPLGKEDAEYNYSPSTNVSAIQL
jgi:hypothetical protein